MKTLSLIALCLIVGILSMGCPKPQPSENKPTNEGQAAAVQDGQKLLNERCTVCHNLNRVKNEQKVADKATWEELIGQMIGRGAKLNETEKATLIEYLLTNPLQ